MRQKALAPLVVAPIGFCQMNILVIADDESLSTRLPEIDADLLISCGDLPDDLILQVAARSCCREILAVKGNHDSSAAFKSPIREMHLVTYEFGGITFGGFCGSWKYKPRGNHLFEQSEVDQHLAAFPPVDIFIAHNSPRLIHDRDDEVHIGFTSFNNYIERAKPKLFLHGHQHENIETRIGETRVIGTFGYRSLVVSV
jgi:Icc-related predicted phosphoesterase